VLLEHADHVAWRLQLADTQVAELAGDHRDQVRLGAFPTALAGFVPSAVARLRVAHRGLRVLISEVTPSTLEPRFLSGEFDVAVSYQDATTDRREIQGAERIDLLEDSFLVGLPPEHRLAGATGPVSLMQFAEDDWVMPSQEGFLVQACRDAGFDPRIVATTSDPVATRGLIARGLGVGWVPSLLIDDYRGVAIRPVKDPLRRRDIYALLPPGDRHPLARQVIDALVEAAADFDD
jgi:DNA-binding transcriptional LysR family regulator